jgi:hypothetical protein
MNTRVSVVGLGYFGKILLQMLRETPDVDEIGRAHV